MCWGFGHPGKTSNYSHFVLMIWLFWASELNYSNSVVMILPSWENESLLTFSTDNVVIMGKWVITHLSCTKFLLKKITFLLLFLFFPEICFDSLLPTDIYLFFLKSTRRRSVPTFMVHIAQNDKIALYVVYGCK